MLKKLKRKVKKIEIMIVCLVDLLEEHNIITHKKWDDRVSKELKETAELEKL